VADERIGIPGGTCAFDLPAYFAWQQHAPAQRRDDLLRWTSTLAPLSVSLHVLLGLLRESGVPHKVVALGGQYQQSLPASRTYHLLRARLPAEADLVPEITGHRLMVSIRLMKADAEGRLRPYTDECAFELALCS
jgi:cell division protein ZapD